MRLLDFGLDETGLASGQLSSRAGTPSILAPELFGDTPATPRTGLCALGVSLYFALTRLYPNDEIEPFQRPGFGEPAPPARCTPCRSESRPSTE